MRVCGAFTVQVWGAGVPIEWLLENFCFLFSGHSNSSVALNGRRFTPRRVHFPMLLLLPAFRRFPLPFRRLPRQPPPRLHCPVCRCLSLRLLACSCDLECGLSYACVYMWRLLQSRCWTGAVVPFSIARVPRSATAAAAAALTVTRAVSVAAAVCMATMTELMRAIWPRSTKSGSFSATMCVQFSFLNLVRFVSSSLDEVRTMMYVVFVCASCWFCVSGPIRQRLQARGSRSLSQPLGRT